MPEAPCALQAQNPSPTPGHASFRHHPCPRVPCPRQRWPGTFNGPVSQALWHRVCPLATPPSLLPPGLKSSSGRGRSQSCWGWASETWGC